MNHNDNASSRSTVPHRESEVAACEHATLLSNHLRAPSAEPAQPAPDSTWGRYADLHDLAPIGYCVLSDTGLILQANRVAATLLGVAEGSLVRQPISRFIFEDDRPAFCEHHRQLSEIGEPQWCELWLLKDDGTKFWARMAGVAVRGTDGGRVCHVVLGDITERERAEAALRESEQRLRAVVETTLDAVITMNADGIITAWNAQAEAVFGWTQMEALGQTVSSLIVPEQHRAAHERGLKRYLDRGAGPILNKRIEITALRKSGDEFPVELAITPVRVGNTVLFSAFMRDITERKLAEAALTEGESRLRAVVEAALDAVITMDAAGLITGWNAQAHTIFGWTPQEAMGQAVSQLIVPTQYRQAHDQGLKRYLASGANALLDDRAESTHACGSSLGSGAGMLVNKRVEITALRKSGEEFPVELTITPVRVGNTVLFSAFMRDITERKKAAEEIERLAFYDPLTGLPNRRLLMDRLGVALAACVRHQRGAALLSIDLDNFRALNDTLGQHKGDQFLQQVSERLLGCIRESETVARLSSDKFVVMLEDLSENRLEAAGRAEAVGGRIRAALSETYQLDGYELHSTVSIGIALFGEQREDIENPLKRADLALSQAKAAGRNNLCFFDPKMQAAAMARSALESDLRGALAKDQFSLYYQPQVTDQRQTTGAEALIRWKHPQRGMASPAEFIPLAEETGIILEVGHWVLETACTQLAHWARAAEAAHLTVAVNVSPRQFAQNDFVQQVLAVLEATGAPAQQLKLELTEGMLVANIEEVIVKMETLQQRGVGFSLDDFGTGYSSLSYLKRLPLNQLKIDKSFVRDVLTDPNDAAIAKTVIALADSLGLAVIAEGVETEAQRDYLASQGCHAYQGYLFCRPVPVQEFEAFARFAPAAAAS